MLQDSAHQSKQRLFAISRNRTLIAEQCDEARPACGQCRKSSRVCPGYVAEFDLIFRNETTAVKRRIEKATQKSNCRGSASRQVVTLSCNLLIAFARIYFQLRIRPGLRLVRYPTRRFLYSHHGPLPLLYNDVHLYALLLLSVALV